MGGGGKGGGGSSTTVQKADPWKGQQPYLTEMFEEAQKLYKNGGLAPGYYPGQTVAGMDSATSNALNLQEQRALAGNAGMNAAQSQLADTMSGTYLNNSPFSADAANPYSGAGNPFSGAANPFAETTNPYTGASNPFAGASNPFAGADNPYAYTDGNPQLDNMVQRAIGQAGAGVNSGFAASGRYGSGAHAAAMNDAAGNIATQMYGQAYDQDQNRSLEAWNANMGREYGAWDANAGREYGAWDANAGREYGTREAAQNRNLEAWNANAGREYGAWDANKGREYGAWDANQNRALSSWNTERDNQIKGMMFAPQLAAADYQDIASLSEVGTARENYAQEQINADMDRYNYNAGRPASALQNYANLIQGNYGMSGSTTSKGSEGKSNPLGGMISGAASGAAIGSFFPGFGTAIGAGAGGLLGLFGSM